MSCHQSRALGLVKSGKAVSPGHTWTRGQRTDGAPGACTEVLGKPAAGRAAASLISPGGGWTARGRSMGKGPRSHAPGSLLPGPWLALGKKQGLFWMHPCAPPPPHCMEAPGDPEDVEDSGLPEELWSLRLNCLQTRAPDTRILGGLPCQKPLSSPAVNPAFSTTGQRPLFLPLTPQAPLYLPNQWLPSLIGDEDPLPQTLVVGSVGPSRA